MTEKENGNGKSFKFIVRLDVVVLVIQFLVLGGSIIYNYVSLSKEIARIGELLGMHTKDANVYVREDVWKVRNEFIDEKLNGIERKIDLLIVRRDDYNSGSTPAKKEN